MQLFEILLLVLTSLLLVMICFFGNRKRFQRQVFYLGIFVLVIHIFFEIIRWQMMFAILVFGFSALLLFKSTVSHLFFRIVGFIIGLLFIGTSAFYVVMMPIDRLPSPNGDYIVGTTSYSIIDGTRLEVHSENANDKRELFVEVWYPSSSNSLKELPVPKSIWNELYKGDIDRVSFFMNYLKGIKTHSYPNIPPNNENELFPLILFNHALQMFTSQNTLLMEHLASHGYIVVSIAHPYESLRVNLPEAGTVMPEFIMSMEKFNQSMEWIRKASAPINKAKDRVKLIDDAEKRASVILEAIESSELNNVVKEWELDNKFILDELLFSNDKNYFFREIIDTSRIGVMGVSIGGAVATEFTKSDDRIKAGINIDGLQYGNRNKEGLKKPFMMLYSEDGKGLNEFLMLDTNNDYYEITFTNSRHPDFTDMTLIWPFMRVYGQLGKIPGDRMVKITNSVIQNFWDSYLKNKPIQEFRKMEYPELEQKVKLKSSL